MINYTPGASQISSEHLWQLKPKKPKPQKHANQSWEQSKGDFHHMTQSKESCAYFTPRTAQFHKLTFISLLGFQHCKTNNIWNIVCMLLMKYYYLKTTHVIAGYKLAYILPPPQKILDFQNHAFQRKMKTSWGGQNYTWW